jgi:acyl-homoserine lactone acylase PvdQ
MITSNLIYNAIQILGFCVFLAAFFNYYKERSGIEFSKYINKGAKMYRDINGVPFIQADTFEDGYFALGFAQAEDRLWSMYFIQKIALGELSELFGEKGLTLDKFARVLNFREVCSGSFKSLNKDEIKLYESFSAGVNHYIDTTYFLPIEFLMFGINHSQIKWKPTSSCLVQKMIEYYLTYDFFQELIRTHLLENINLSLEVISKLFPYNFDNYEFRRTIIKDEEMKDLKQEKKVIVTNEIKHAYIDENGKVMRNLDELEFKKSHAYAEKSNASLDNDEIDVNIYESKNSSLDH